MSKAFHQDFSARTAAKRAGSPRGGFLKQVAHRFLFYAGVLTLAGFGFLALFGSSEEVDAKASNTQQEEWLQPELPEAAAQPQNRLAKEVLMPGDTAAAALGRLGFSYADALQMIEAAKPLYSLKNVMAGHAFGKQVEDGRTSVYYNIDGSSRLLLSQPPQGGEWQAEIQQRGFKTRRMLTSGSIDGSLFLSAGRAGLSDSTTMNLVDIFAWDIDFARDMRKGDTFQVLYEERYDDAGKYLGSVILSARFVNQGHAYDAVRYERPDGTADYFSPDGKSMRKAFLKAPVKFSRISSTFSLHRKHPILGYTRAHRGVDYAAPLGTPVHAVADGRITFVGWHGGHGKFIQIKHTHSDKTTGYAHLSRYAKSIHKGTHVHQGQVIGYVGSTGMSTGPHLHYEVKVNGKYVNPLTIKGTPATPVPAKEMARFKAQATPLLARLHEHPTLLAWD